MHKKCVKEKRQSGKQHPAPHAEHRAAAAAGAFKHRMQREHEHDGDKHRHAHVERRVHAEIQPRKRDERGEHDGNDSYPAALRRARDAAEGADGVLCVAAGEGEARRLRAGGLHDLKVRVQHPGPRDAEGDLERLIEDGPGKAHEKKIAAPALVDAPVHRERHDHKDELLAKVRDERHRAVEQRRAQRGKRAQNVEIRA